MKICREWIKKRFKHSKNHSAVLQEQMQRLSRAIELVLTAYFALLSQAKNNFLSG